MSTKINQKFQNLPLELVRHIIGFARPQYEYMDELTWCNKYLQFDGEWNKANPGMFNNKFWNSNDNQRIAVCVGEYLHKKD